MANNQLTSEMAAELAKLALMPEEEIDTSDAPEVLDWSGAQRGLFSPEKLQVRGYDVRALANWFLDRAIAAGVSFSNLSLNKLVYLAIERALVERLVLLTQARIEAWEHGPVLREVYQSFKSFENRPVTERASRFSSVARGMIEARDTIEPEDEDLLENVFRRYGGKTAGELRAISHIKGGPWHKVWHYRGITNPGMEITAPMIFEYAPMLHDPDE